VQFVNEFRPERGDLMYGLRDTRTVYLNQWQAHIGLNSDRVMKFLKLTTDRQKPNWNIIDNYNDYFFLGGNVDFSGATGSYSKALGELYARLSAITGQRATIDQSSTWKKETQLTQRVAYVTELERSRFSPLNSFTADPNKVAREGFTPGISGSADAALQQNRSYLAIRRACKFGIGMVASDMAFAGCKIHFVLDGLNLSDVATKAPRAGYGGRTAVPITTSEIRYVFRKWNDLRNTVIFYVNLNSVNPPWEDDWSLQPVDNMPPNPLRAYKGQWDAYGQQRAASGKAASTSLY